MSEKIKNRIVSLLAGMACGILMGTLVLYLSLTTGFMIGQVSFWLIMVIVCALPLCLGVFQSSGLSLGLAQAGMICASFAIIMIYAMAMQDSTSFAARYENISDTVYIMDLFLHGAAAVVCIGAALLRKAMNRQKKQK